MASPVLSAMGVNVNAPGPVTSGDGNGPRPATRPPAIATPGAAISIDGPGQAAQERPPTDGALEDVGERLAAAHIGRLVVAGIGAFEPAMLATLAGQVEHGKRDAGRAVCKGHRFLLDTWWFPAPCLPRVSRP